MEANGRAEETISRIHPSTHGPSLEHPMVDERAVGGVIMHAEAVVRDW